MKANVFAWSRSCRLRVGIFCGHDPAQGIQTALYTKQLSSCGVYKPCHSIAATVATGAAHRQASPTGMLCLKYCHPVTAPMANWLQTMAFSSVDLGPPLLAHLTLKRAMSCESTYNEYILIGIPEVISHRLEWNHVGVSSFFVFSC